MTLNCKLPDKILVECRCDLDLEFSRSNMEFPITQLKIIPLPQNKKQTYQLNSRPWMCPSHLTMAMTLTWNFQGQIWNLLYLSQKWSDRHKTKNKHTGNVCTLCFKCGHKIWPWLKFSRSNVKFAISQPKLVWLPLNEKQIYQLNSISNSNAVIGFDLGHNLDLGFSWSNFEAAVSQE